jgi:hypothetical protein
MGAPMELRKATRYRLNAPVFYWWESADGTLQEAQGITRDISDRGVFVVAKQLPPAGVRVEVDVHLPAVSRAARSAQLHGEGAVLRICEPEAKESGFAAAVVFHAESSDAATVLGSRKVQ